MASNTTSYGSGQNGNKTNGYQNGASGSQKPVTQPTPSKKSGSEPGLFSTVMSLRRDSKRPLPNELGDGTYRKVVTRPGIGQDLRSLSMAGE